MTSNSDAWATIAPGDLVRCLSRRWPSIVLTTLVVTILSAIGLAAWPNRYASDGLFYARLGRGAISMDPTTDPTRSVSFQESRASQVASISEMLHSREIADRVVRAVGAREINHPRTWIDHLARRVSSLKPELSGSAKPDRFNMDRTEYDRRVAHEEAVETIMESVSIKVPKNSYTVAVAAQSSDPLLAQKMVQAIMDEFGAYHVEAHQSTGSLEFFEQQAQTSHATAIAARQALHQARNEMGWISTESAEQSLRERILNLELSLDRTESELADARSQTESMETRLQMIREWIPMQITTVANNASDGMRTHLYEFKLQDSEQLSKLTANHPRYRTLRGKIDQGEDLVSLADDEREQTVEAINPIRMSLETSYQTAMTTAAGYESRRQSLLNSLQAAKNELQRLHHDAVRLAELGWAADIAERHYVSHSQSLEASRVTQELDNQNMSDVSVIQAASLNLKKVGPPRLLLAGVASMMGLTLGLLQATVRAKPFSANCLETGTGETAIAPRTRSSEVMPGSTGDRESSELHDAETPELVAATPH